MEEKKWQAGGPRRRRRLCGDLTDRQFHRHGADEIIAEIIPYRIHGSSQSDLKQLGSTSLRYTRVRKWRKWSASGCVPITTIYLSLEMTNQKTQLGINKVG